MKRVANIFSMIAAVCLMVLFLPTNAIADDAYIYLSDILNAIDDGSTDVPGNGWSFDEETEIITINENTYIMINGNNNTCNWQVVNHGTISGGTFMQPVVNEGIISADAAVFRNTVQNSGTISGGMFYGDVTTISNGSITGGSFAIDTSNLKNITISSELVIYDQENTIVLSTDINDWLLPLSINITLDSQPAKDTDYEYIRESNGYGYVKITDENSKKKIAISGEARPAVKFTTDERLPDATVGQQYTAQLNATGDGPIKYEIVDDDTRPSWLTLSKDGTISGIPTISYINWPINIKASNDMDSTQQTFTLTIKDAEEEKIVYYELKMADDLQEKVIISPADPEGKSVWMKDGQYWIIKGDSAINILPEAGYQFIGFPQITFVEGKGSAQTTDGTHYQLIGVAGDGTITANVAQWQEYEVISGGDQTYTGSGDLRPIKVNGNIAKLKSVSLLQGPRWTELTKDNDYTVEAGAEGTTIIVLKESFLKLLEDGVCGLNIVYTDGGAHTVFTVEKSSAVDPTADDLPKTGDDSHPFLWLGLMLASITGICACGVARSKRRVKG